MALLSKVFKILLTQSLYRAKRYKCTVIPGDGVGPELMQLLSKVFKAVDAPIDFEPIIFSEVTPLSAPLNEVIDSILRNGICVKGILEYDNNRSENQSLNMKLRLGLDLFANVVHVRSLPGIKTRHNNVDVVIIREQTEGEYTALEHECVPGVVESLKIVTAEKSLRIAKFAFDYATKNKRKKVTAVHKANIMKLGDGLFLNSCQEMSKLYPRIHFEKMIIDNTTMQMVSNPNQFDVMVMPNLYGLLIDNIAAGLVGGAGLVAGVSYSSNVAVFEQGARHVFARAVGKKLANPTAILLCGTKLLWHLNFQELAKKIYHAISNVLKDGKIRTKDIGGNSTSEEFICAIISNLEC